MRDVSELNPTEKVQKVVRLALRTVRSLVVKDPTGEVRRVELGEAPMRVGTHPASDFVLRDKAASRAHAELRSAPNGVVVRDLGSTNGCHLNGVWVMEGVLEPGMTLVLGATSITIEGAREESLALPTTTFGSLVGASMPMRALFRELGQIAPSNATVLVEAESGCGKELLARSVHQSSLRAGKPFVVFDCASVATNLIESALFGHERGAFTGAVDRKSGVFEEADGGTLFLDEIGELPLDLQPRLLRALETREVRRVGGAKSTPIDVRIIAATNRDLLREVNAGTFREDLYFRLAVLRVRIPPLRERLEDIPLLVEHLVRHLVGDDPERARQALARVNMEQWVYARQHAWRGNVRELRNAVERVITLGAAPSPLTASSPTVPVSFDRPFIEQREALLEAFESAFVKGMLERHDGNFSRAAAAAGIDRMYFKRLLRKHER